jgi:ABC-2 type transport system ATP-binding protein
MICHGEFMSRNVVLSVQNLKKIYPGKIPYIAVGGISFELKEGEILGMLGSNGAGKTTTIQMLLSTLKATSGSIHYFGKDFFKHRSEVLKHVAFASTYVSLPWMLTVEQNLEVFSRLYGLSAAERKERIDPLLERFGISSKRKSFVSQLSAGQITRLMLVKAFMIRPKIALLDEPTASLDPDIAQDVIEFVLEQRKKFGTSVLYTSHNMAEVGEICDRVLFLQQGKIIADDLPQNLAKSVAVSRVQLQVGDGMKRIAVIAKRLKMCYKIEHRTIEFELDESQIAILLSALAEAGVIYTNINILQPTLEDFFLHMVKKGGQK